MISIVLLMVINEHGISRNVEFVESKWIVNWKDWKSMLLFDIK